jgi:Mg2+-importing ATPase
MRSNALFQGSHVVSGTGRAVVAQTGANTVFGEIAGQLRLRPPATEFERGLRHFGGLLIQILLLLGITAAYLVASELVKGWFFRRFA